jgi:hypothetical protein
MEAVGFGTSFFNELVVDSDFFLEISSDEDDFVDALSDVPSYEH